MKPNSAPWMIRVLNAHWAIVMYSPRIPPILTRCSLACSSDQKNVVFRQNASMMLGSVSLAKSTSGANMMGLAPSSVT